MLRQLRTEAKRDEELQMKLKRWIQIIRDKGVELRNAVEEWQQKRSRDPDLPLLTTGFLDGALPLVDSYELKVIYYHYYYYYYYYYECSRSVFP
jgi:atypical dual specificity phosphatase